MNAPRPKFAGIIVPFFAPLGGRLLLAAVILILITMFLVSIQTNPASISPYVRAHAQDTSVDTDGYPPAAPSEDQDKFVQSSALDESNQHGVIGSTADSGSYGGYFTHTGEPGGGGLYALGATGWSPDIILGGVTSDSTGSGADDGVLQCDRQLPGCDLIFIANNRVEVEIGRSTSGAADAYFKVQDRQGDLLSVLGNGRTIVKELQITGGADLAEQFDVRGFDTVHPKPGMVVSIDSDQPGQLLISHEAYDQRVAGVLSGAGGVKPGLILQQEGTIAVGEYPVSLTGRVYVWADASNGTIQPGDLLTTSDTPGHAMKVANYDQAQGAILGKAMSALEEGMGLVLVLVTLQ